MSVLCDVIAEYIEEQLEHGEGAAELCRSELAQNFGCTPSQITYVLRTRFSVVRGYHTESRRGGGGYVRVKRVEDGNQACRIADVVREHLTGPVTRRQAEDLVKGLLHMGVIDAERGRVMLAAVSDRALQGAERTQAGIIRAAILSQMLLACAGS